MICKLTPYEVSLEVKKYLDREKVSLRDFCNKYNTLNNMEIRDGAIKPLNKDFLLRVKNNEFKVVNKRVLDLCDYLGLNVSRKVLSKSTMVNEFQNLQKIAQKHPYLEEKLINILAEVGELLTTNING
ncbi:hypothetical protein F959_01632 [Acinetobacter venetianus RAG-1 = CIP 110063]|uniref:Uncharacterized protein n=1 Tax=Acinetobacter venetianus (strain ATCC 31012 / DSM 23050 / BCRC 14357 / CCUG 45561 / CIP 110063 / KCTC 2702 / LMG 19082 / RAG-1) TaxID=1191460 RepID=N8ZUR9_ACIVR|nr:hypothetical protein [Acinetobacter venetianus]ENV37509.1 hypothetical protein F959_01632 [Acinetobacter venetianus RAG-1 = CIP 110063]